MPFFIVQFIFYRNPLRSKAVSRFDITKAIPILERKGYRKSILELEMVLGVPENVSVLSR